MIIEIKKEKNLLKVIREGKKIDLVNFKDYFYFSKEGNMKLIEKLRDTKFFKMKEEFKKKELKKYFKGKEKNLEFIEFPASLRKEFNKALKDLKELLKESDEDLKEKLLDSIFEYDVKVEDKFLIDTKIDVISNIECTKKLAFDLEIWSEGFPNPKEDPIVLASFFGDDIKKVIVYNNKDFKNKLDLNKVEELNKKLAFNYDIDIVKTEKELIIKTLKILSKYDLIFSYNGDNFDIPFLKERAKRYSLDLENLISLKGVQNKKTNIENVSHIDLFIFIRNILSNRLHSELLNLDQVSKELLGEDKLGSWKYIKDINELIPYNFKDSFLTFRLANYLMPIMIQLAKITNRTLFDVSRATYGKHVENYLMLKTRDFNELIPRQAEYHEIIEREKITYEGAFVYEPKPGFYENIAVLDFQSLYPSIIVTFNICPSSYDGFVEISKEEKDNITVKNLENETHFISPPIEYYGKRIRLKFKKMNSFIPEVLKSLIERRLKLKDDLKELKKKNADEKLIKFIDAEQYSLKILINSIYGYMGYSRARWFFLEGAMATTAFGRFFIKEVIKKAEEKGFKVIYGDTDSLFLSSDSNNKEKVLDFLDYINRNFLPGIVNLSLEDFYPRGIFVSSRSGEKGAKKKYALINEEGKIKIRGFETVRRDWAIITKELQNKIIKLILNNKKKEALEYVKEVIDKIKKREISKDKLVIYTQLRKDLHEYESEGPHVKIAKKLKEKGLKVGSGTIISYIVGEGSGNIKDKVFLPDENKKYDVNYYINNQIIPAVENIFKVVGINIKEEIKNISNAKKQSNLLNFINK